MEINRKTISVGNHEIAYTHVETGSQTICFMFSGAGYTYDKPLLYYSTMVMLENAIDVIHIHYNYGHDFLKYSLEDISETMLADVKPIVSHALQDGKYNHIIFLGKSLGTIPMTLEFMKHKDFLHSKMILLTPLLKYDAIFSAIKNSTQQGLLVIGDQDPHYHANKLAQLSQSNLVIETIPDANHSLEMKGFNTEKSISVLSHVMDRIEEIVNVEGKRLDYP